MRFNVQGVSGQGAQQVVTPPPNGGPQSVTFNNAGTTNIWIADNQTNLITSVVAGTPNYGVLLVPGAVYNNPKVIGGRWALTSGPLGALEIEASGC
jgi:hypothetical protein